MCMCTPGRSATRVQLRARRTSHLGGTIRYTYCILGSEEINTWRARGAAARVSVNFRKFSPCIARARRARAGLTVYPPSRTLELLAFDEYCRFDTSAFASRIKRARGRVNCQTRAGAPRARCMEKIYGNLRKPAHGRRARVMR